MTLPIPALCHTLTLGEEDGKPVHVALLRCVVWASYVELASMPAGALLTWTDDRDTVYAAMPVDAADIEKHDEWFEAEPDMGACWHDVVWHSGERSSSATVSDLYLGDNSVLLTIVTPAAQQEQNMSEFGRPAYGVPVEGDQPNDRYVELVRGTLARLSRTASSDMAEHLLAARSLLSGGAKAHDDLASIRVFAESWSGRESSDVPTLDVVRGLELSLDPLVGRAGTLPPGTEVTYRRGLRRSAICFRLNAQTGGLGLDALGQLLAVALRWTDEECSEMEAFMATKHEDPGAAMPNCLRRAIGKPEK